jgi:hypothetical protein
MTSLTPLETQMTRILLDGDLPELAVLRSQLALASVSSRKMTGVGFYTDFALPKEFPRLEGCPSFKIGDVNGRATNVKHGLGFVLYVNDGALSQLEGYTYDEPWPEKIEGLQLEYTGGGPRDLAKMSKTFQQARRTGN